MADLARTAGRFDQQHAAQLGVRPEVHPDVHPDGACRTGYEDAFARVPYEPAAAARAREQAAKAVCGGCPVRIACRRSALADRVRHGVRGGLTADERHVLLLDRSPTLG
ncbi:WhiB family transcriptional regulator [Streptomyces sp. NPDC089799]|uniref:WhiB family transcriptional regulator n=1 Tax=Streptomyces sp. NPDC089799 TaxID=3155066 RepID=UPI00341CEBB5